MWLRCISKCYVVFPIVGMKFRIAILLFVFAQGLLFSVSIKYMYYRTKKCIKNFSCVTLRKQTHSRYQMGPNGFVNVSTRGDPAVNITTSALSENRSRTSWAAISPNIGRSQTSTRIFSRLTPNDPYMGRTAPLTSKRCILYIYSTNIGTEYF